MFIYIKASNPYSISSPIENIVKGIVVVCGLEKVIINGVSNDVFNINADFG